MARRDRTRSSTIGLVGLVLLSACRESPTTPDGPTIGEEEASFREVELREWGAIGGADVVSYLDDPSAAVRARAAQALGELACDVQTAIGGVLVRETDANVRAAIVRALRDCTEPAARRAIDRAATDEDVVVRAAAAEARQTIEDLASHLDDAAAEVRRAALRRALELGRGPADGRARFTREEDERVRWWYAALGLAGDPLAALADRNFLVAVFGIAPWPTTAPAPDDVARVAAVAAGGRFWARRAAAIEALVRAVRASEGDEQIRMLASDVLTAVIRAEDAPAALSRAAAVALPQVLSEAAALDELAREGSDRHRDSLVRGLVARIGGARDPWPLGTNLAREWFAELRESTRAHERVAAVELAGPLEEPLAWAFDDPAGAVRRSAVRSARVRTPDEARQLIRRADASARADALHAAARSREELEREAARAILRSGTVDDWQARAIAVTRLERSDAHRVFVRGLLSDLSWPVRLAAANWLGERASLDPSVFSRGTFPVPLLRRRLDYRHRHPRAVVRLRDDREFVVEFDAAAAPFHASALVLLAETGYFEGRELVSADWRSGIEVTAPAVSADFPLAAEPLPAARVHEPILRGSLFVPFVAPGVPVTTAGELWIALVPRPRLRAASRIGRVVLGMRVVDDLAPGDRIESVEVVR